MRGRPARVDAPADPTVVPGVVTELVPATRRPGRWQLAVDGQDVGHVSLDLVERFGLRVGQSVDDELAAQLVVGIAEIAVYDRAVGMLAVRARSARELRQRLIRAGAAPDHIDSVITRLQAAGVLDDAEYARQVARSRVAGRGDSRRRVAQALAHAGVGRAVADEAVAAVYEEESVDEVKLAEHAAAKCVRTLGALDPAVRRRRLYGYLARRGHDASVIREVMARIVGVGDTEGEDDPERDAVVGRA